MKFSRFFSDTTDLDQIDWKVMQLRHWKNTPRDQDIERRRQAEFLVHEKVPLKLVKGIVTKTQSAFMKVENLRMKYVADDLKAKMGVKPDWYY